MIFLNYPNTTLTIHKITTDKSNHAMNQWISTRPNNTDQKNQFVS